MNIKNIKYSVILTLLLCPLSNKGQGQPPGTAQEEFNINGVKTLIGPGGFMWD